ncbi:hypothetical protein F5884DRAFT_349915 [Xylogone sp. PMI_703]|nr:hypothetical protein F5884DRAFT_349915 [Xylogone sp. PMI_703]
MHLTVLLSALAIVGASARNAINPITGRPSMVGRYPICPENYETYCCMTVVPYSNSCSGGKCTNNPGWSCVMGPGKVESMKYCLKEVGGNKDAFCKRPGYEYFGSVLKWTGGSFEPMLQPQNYRHYLRAGMKAPWVPPRGAIRWEEEEDESETTEPEREELRKREAVFGDTDMA